MFYKMVKMTQNCLKKDLVISATEVFNRDGIRLLYFNSELPKPFACRKNTKGQYYCEPDLETSISRSGTGLSFRKWDIFVFAQCPNSCVRRLLSPLKSKSETQKCPKQNPKLRLPYLYLETFLQVKWGLNLGVIASLYRRNVRHEICFGS